MRTRLSIKLKNLRVAQGLTGIDVIKRLKNFGMDYSLQAIYKWEDGTSKPNLQVLLALSKIYHCDISYLVEERNLTYKNLTASEIFYLHQYRNNFLFKSIAVQIMRLG